MKRTDKSQVISDVVEKITRTKSMFIADFTGITVEEVNELRREFRKANIDYKVVKNTLARKAMENVTGYDSVVNNIVGPTAIAFSYDDPVVPAKIIKKFREKYQKLNLKVCVIENVVYDGSRLDEIAKLPSRNEMIAGILGSLQAPLSGVIGAVSAVMRDLISVIDAIEKKKAS